MSFANQYLDWEGLSYYNDKIKTYIGDRTCSIGEDGYWYIGGQKTEYMAQGIPGANGEDGIDGVSVTISNIEETETGVTVTFSDGNSITINHGVDGEDGDVLNMQLGQEIKTNVACGALGIGQTLTADLTLADIVKKLTTTVYEPSKGDTPKATLAMSGQSTTVEVGTTIKPTLTPSFTDGTFNTYDKGATVSKSMNAGCEATGYTISRGETEIASGTALEAFTDSYPISEETVTYKTTISYSDSNNYPTDSDGDEDTTVTWGASSASANSTSVTGKYQYYTGCSDVDPTADEIRAVLNDTENWIDTLKTIDVENTNTKMIFAIPSGYSLVSAISSIKENQTSNFVKSTITIKDAGGNDVLYNLYIMTNSLVGNFTITFTYKKGQ